MNVYLIYVVFDHACGSPVGYIGEWKGNLLPVIYAIGQEDAAQKFISEKAAQAFAENLKSYYGEKLLHYEIVTWQPSSK